MLFSAKTANELVQNVMNVPDTGAANIGRQLRKTLLRGEHSQA